jgi:pimeloyl-ACP methyl ester carboxylesterase
MGEEPPAVLSKTQISRKLRGNSSYPEDYLDEVIGEPSLPANIKKMTVGPYYGLAENLWGNIYFPAGAVIDDSVTGKLPLVIYLHEYAYSTGYHRKGIPAIRKLTSQGFAVLAFDMMGFGARIEEAAGFYQRYPHWSVLGKMVADTRGIINDACTRMPFIDSTNIYLAGHSLGGTVALFTAALDARVKGTAVVSAFSSLRKPAAGTEGIRHYSHLHGLLPKLGFFVGNEGSIPLDFDEIITCIAPRSLLVIAPEHDRNHPITSVREMIGGPSDLYNGLKKKEKFKFEQPSTFSHFPDSLQQQVAEWLFKDRSTHL